MRKFRIRMTRSRKGRMNSTITRKDLKGDAILIVAAFIFGSGLVSQKAGMDHLGPFAFTAIRFLIGAVILIPIAAIIRSRKPKEVLDAQLSIREMIPGGVISGVNILIGVITQQYGLPYTSVGKAGFICSLYVIMTPLVGMLFLHRKVSPRVLLAAVIAVAGFYVMSFANGLEALSRGDILMFLTAISLTGYVYTIDYFAGKAEASAFTCIQFLAVGACAIPLALIFERSTTLADVTACMWPLLYAGVIMCAMGYTLQMIGQETVESTRATILLSLESLFSMLSGMVFYHEHLMPKEYLGCLLIFIAVLIAETKKSTGEGKR